MKKFREKEEKEREKKIAELTQQSKNLYEIVVEEEFDVEQVIGETHATSHTPVSEMRIGGRSPIYHTGFTSKLILKVTSTKADMSVHLLNFNGISPVMAGHHIRVQIPRYEEKKMQKDMFDYSSHERTFYLDRAFNLEETAIELSIIGENGRVLKTDRAVEYDQFQKK